MCDWEVTRKGRKKKKKKLAKMFKSLTYSKNITNQNLKVDSK